MHFNINHVPKIVGDTNKQFLLLSGLYSRIWIKILFVKLENQVDSITCHTREVSKMLLSFQVQSIYFLLEKSGELNFHECDGIHTWTLELYSCNEALGLSKHME